MAPLTVARGTMIVKKEYPPETDVADQDARIGVLAGVSSAFASNLFYALVGAVLRSWLAQLWVTPGGRNVDLTAALGLPQISGLLLGLALWLLMGRRWAPWLVVALSALAGAVLT